MIPAFPKIFALGQKYTTTIFEGPVEITEKIDGSQFSFGLIDGKLHIRSKGQEINADENCQKMFQIGLDWVLSIYDKLRNNVIYHGEYLNKPKHNALAYNRVPLNNFMLFGIRELPDRFVTIYDELKNEAEYLGCEAVPLLMYGITHPDNKILEELLGLKSVLGNVNIEGFVVKNYNQSVLFAADIVIPIMMGKYVSEEFKELNHGGWKDKSKHPSIMGLIEKYKTEARWGKAIQHLRDNGQLTNEPKDIGPLIQEVIRDIEEEELENIKTDLFALNKKMLRTGFTRGLPEWYKKRLFTGS